MPNGSVYEQWNTVLDEYNDPDWFANQIWDPFSRPSGTMPGFDSWQTAWDFTSPERLQKAYGSYFNRFNTADWDTLDQLHALDIQLLDQEINFTKDLGNNVTSSFNYNFGNNQANLGIEKRFANGGQIANNGIMQLPMSEQGDRMTTQMFQNGFRPRR